MTARFCLAPPESAARRNGAEASPLVALPDKGNRDRMASSFVAAQQHQPLPQ
jgi:hypothetical protein